MFSAYLNGLVVLRGLNGQNNEGRSLFDKGSRKMGAKRLIKQFPNNTTTSLEYVLLRTTVTVVADGLLTSINQT